MCDGGRKQRRAAHSENAINEADREERCQPKGGELKMVDGEDCGRDDHTRRCADTSHQRRLEITSENRLFCERRDQADGEEERALRDGVAGDRAESFRHSDVTSRRKAHPHHDRSDERKPNEAGPDGATDRVAPPAEIARRYATPTKKPQTDDESRL